MRSAFTLCVVLVLCAVVSAQTYCTSSAGCNDITTDHHRWCNTTRNADKCLSLNAVSDFQGTWSNNGYCSGLFANTTHCIKFAMTGCSVSPGIYCAPGSTLDSTTQICTPERPAYNTTPCSNDYECVEGTYCKQYIGTKRAIQNECSLPAVTGEVCGANNLPCENGVCFNNVCRKYVNTGGRCVNNGYAQCNPLSSVCNLGQCRLMLSLANGKACDENAACQSFHCLAGHCVPSDGQVCTTNADCGYTEPNPYPSSFSGSLPSLCRDGKCFAPALSKTRTLFKCLHRGVFDDSKPQVDVRNRLLAKCGKQYAESICSMMCLHPEDRRRPLSSWLGLDMRNMTVNCATKTISLMASNCELVPSALYSGCETVKEW